MRPAVALALAAFLVLPGTAAAQALPDQLIVGFEKKTGGSAQKRIIRRARGEPVKRFAPIRAWALRPRAGASLEGVRALLRRSRRVAYVERDAPAGILKTPNDPLFPTQYSENGAIANGLPAAWDIQTTCSRVAVLDTGLDTDHPDLNANIWRNRDETPGNGRDDDRNGYVDDYFGVDLVSGRGSAEDDNGHGTHVSGIVAARGDNGAGVAGVCWSAAVMPVKFMTAAGEGLTSTVVEGIEYAVENGAKVVNASFVSSSRSRALVAEIGRAARANVLIVAAAGNDGRDIDARPRYPASYRSPNLLVVAASTSADTLASFSNHGAESVDVAAPGDGVVSTNLGGGYRLMSGTSMATPMVAGLAAMLRARRPGASYSRIRSAIRRSVDRLPAFSGATSSGGRVNLARALAGI